MTEINNNNELVQNEEKIIYIYVNKYEEAQKLARQKYFSNNKEKIAIQSKKRYALKKETLNETRRQKYLDRVLTQPTLPDKLLLINLPTEY